MFIHSNIFESRFRIKTTKGNKCYLERTATFRQDMKYGGIHINIEITNSHQHSGTLRNIHFKLKIFSIEVRY